MVIALAFRLHCEWPDNMKNGVNPRQDSGACRYRGRVPNDFPQLQQFFLALGEPSRAILEAGWNWGLMSDWLEQVGNVTEVQLVHPYRTAAGGRAGR